MSDPFHQPPQHWNPFEFILGIGGMLSPWWGAIVHGFDATVAGVTFYGGGFLVGVQVWRYARGKYRAWQDRR